MIKISNYNKNYNKKIQIRKYKTRIRSSNNNCKMKIEVKNCIKLIDYEKSMQILEKRVEDVYSEKKNDG